MTNREFDAVLHKRANGETMLLSAEAQARFLFAQQKAAQLVAKPAAYNRRMSLALVGCMLAVLLLVCLRPAADRVQNGVLPADAVPLTFVPTAQKTIVPDVRFDVAYDTGKALVQVDMENQTDETWLIAWHGRQEGFPFFRGVAWLEAGAKYAACTGWRGHMPKTGRIETCYTAYRITADMLHWVEPPIPIGEDGYEDQQSLLQDGMDANALSLSACEWANGEAGEVRLMLPEAYLQTHSLESEIDYYVRVGALTQGIAQQEMHTLQTVEGAMLDEEEAALLGDGDVFYYQRPGGEPDYGFER